MRDKNIPWTSVYRRFIDVRAKFMEGFPNSGYHGKPGLKFMAECEYLPLAKQILTPSDFKIVIENHHSGIADCKTIAKIVTKMLENGTLHELGGQ